MKTHLSKFTKPPEQLELRYGTLRYKYYDFVEVWFMA